MKDQRFLARYGSALVLLGALVVAGCASKSPSSVSDRSASTAVVDKDMYTVKKGDTLYSIAAEHGVDFRELIVLNRIDNPNRILVGQSLRVRPAGSAVGAGATVVRPIDTASSVEQRSLSASGDTLKREPLAGKEPYSEQALARAQAPAPVQHKTAEPAAAATAAAPSTAKPAEVAAGSDDVAWMWPASGKLVGTFNEGGAKGIDISGNAGEPVLAAGGGKVVYSGTGLRGYGKLVIVKHNSTYLTAYAHNQSILVKEGQTVAKGQKIAEMGNTDADQVKLHFEVRRQGKPVDPLKYLPPR
ncbi:peptidoglycan DD-metalloendopeptidase family protein [Accumulibacter sp.]|uniref:peptidoglycan DD-metalloendopeptidase family protein n=1 Tax=Accumulibacter sp. TaxID=2053492 RepID=UPI0028C49A6E|nr:peptidoglycan DD-metalloendopeptidase family protein [Accumulibacter sp.]